MKNKYLHRQWDFQVFPLYEIRLSQYGPGGSYDFETDRSKATAVVLAKRSGEINQSSHARIPIHEFTHCGIEGCIVDQFGLCHEEKERVVDLLIAHTLGSILPTYEILSQASDIDRFVTSDTVSDLPKAISQYLAQFPVRT